MAEEPWEPTSAREALILLREEHDAWTDLVPRALGPGQDMSDPQRVLRSLHRHAALLLTWTRGLDDMADGANGHASYTTARATNPELLDAAVYACNRAIHQLIHVGRYSQGGRSYPKSHPMSFAPASLTWVTAGSLPPESADSGPTRWRRRTAYLNRWAGQPMTDGLGEILAFMDAQIGPEVGLSP